MATRTAPRPAPAANSTAQVAVPSATYLDMEVKWREVRALWGGTASMREAGDDYLPREPKETQPAYDNRLARTTLFNAFRRTIKQLSGKPFRKPPKQSEQMPPEMEKWCENVDNNGHDLGTFLKNWMEDGLQAGISHVLVDFPPQLREPTTGKPKTLSVAEERELNRRPYLTLIRADDLIGWRSEKVSGKHVLTQIRIRENTFVPNGKWGEREVERIRVIEKTGWELWEKSALNNGTWFIRDSGQNTLGEIGLSTFYANGSGFMRGEPTLMDLADINISHWQSSSDQRHILHVARVPLLFGKNLGAKTAPDGVPQSAVALEIGPNRMIVGGENSDLKYVEHAGAAIGAGRQDMIDMEDRMAVMGLELLVRGPRMTATQKTIDTVESDSELHAIVGALENATAQALLLAAEWINMTLPEGAEKVTLDKDFGITSREAGEIETLLKMRQAGEITRQTYYAGLMRRGFFEEGFDAEAEAEAVEAEAPKLLGPPMALNGQQQQQPPRPGSNGAGEQEGANA